MILKILKNKLIKTFSNRKAEGAAEGGMDMGKFIMTLVIFLVVVGIVVTLIVFFNGEYTSTFAALKTWLTKLKGLVPAITP